LIFLFFATHWGRNTMQQWNTRKQPQSGLRQRSSGGAQSRVHQRKNAAPTPRAAERKAPENAPSNALNRATHSENSENTAFYPVVGRRNPRQTWFYFLNKTVIRETVTNHNTDQFVVLVFFTAARDATSDDSPMCNSESEAVNAGNRAKDQAMEQVEALLQKYSASKVPLCGLEH
jgi:hypothetical protein